MLLGESIELTDPFSDNNAGKNWKSGITGGSPGKTNYRTIPDGITPELKECMLICYPNPFRDFTTLYLEVSAQGRYKVEVFDLQGSIITEIFNQTLDAGQYYIDWNGLGNRGNLLSDGVYILRLSGEKQHYNTKVIILR